MRPGPDQRRAGAPSVSPMPYWVELKGLALIPGSYPASVVNYADLDASAIATAAKNRYRTMIALTQGGDDAFGAYRLVDTSNGPALARFHFAGQNVVELEGLSAEDLNDLAKDQLTVLGQIHRKSLSSSVAAAAMADFARTLRENEAELETLVRDVAADFKASHAALGS